MISALCFALCAGAILHAALLRRNLFSPVYIYWITQALTLGIAYLKLDRAMTDLHLFTWVVLLGAAVSFLFGSYSARLGFFSPLQANGSAPILEPYNWRLHHILSWVAFMVYLAICAPVYSYSGGFPLLSEKLTELTSTKQNLGYLAYGYSSGPFIILLFSMSSFRRLCPTLWIRMISRWMVLFSTVFMVLMNPTRSSFMCAMAILIMNLHFLHKRIQVWIIPLIIFLAIPSFIVLGYAKSQYGSEKSDLTISKLMKLPYFYVANNYWNLDYALNPRSDKEIHPFTYGLDGINGITEFVGVGYTMSQAFHWDNPYNIRVSKISNFNTTGYLWEAYKDFWVVGVIGIPFLVAFFVSWLYHRQRLSFSVRRHMLFVLYMYFIGMWWFIESYKNGQYWLWTFFILFITTLCAKVPRQQNS